MCCFLVVSVVVVMMHQDVLKAIYHVHSTGAMHAKVLEDPPTYLTPAPHLRVTLKR